MCEKSFNNSLCIIHTLYIVHVHVIQLIKGMNNHCFLEECFYSKIQVIKLT